MFTRETDSRRRGYAKTALVWLLAWGAARGFFLYKPAPKPAPPASAGLRPVSAEQAGPTRLRTKNIEDIQVGDYVLAKDPEQPRPPTPHKVVGLPRNWTEYLVHLVVAGGGELQATRSQPFWVEGRGWTEAKEIHVGDKLRDDGDRAVVVNKTWIEARTTDTYNLSVDGAHTFYVIAGERPVLVHNVNTYGDPTQPGYSNGASNLDHIRARSLGGGNGRSNLQSLPAETNFRKGGLEGQLSRDWNYYRNNGMSDADIERVLGDEIKSLGKSPPPRPMSNESLDTLPSKPCP